MEYIENCVVCKKYLNTLALQEQAMCNDVIQKQAK